MFLLLCVALSVLGAILWVVKLHQNAFAKLAHINGPAPKPFIGNVADWKNASTHIIFQRYAQEYGGVCKFFVGLNGSVLISDPGLVQEMGVKNFEMLPNRPRLQTRVRESSGLLWARDEYWRRLRRTISPLFNVLHLKGMLRDMSEASLVLLTKLERASNAGHEVDIHNLFNSLTLDVIGATAFATKIESQQSYQHPLATAARTMFRNATGINSNLIAVICPPLGRFLSAYFPNQARRDVNQALDVIDSTSLDMIKRKRAEKESIERTLKENKSETDNNNKSNESKHSKVSTLLDMLIDARDKETGRSLTDVEIRDQSNTFLLAGQDTTANAMSYVVYLVSQHPEVDAKIHEELRRVLGDETTEYGTFEFTPTLDQLKELKYLSMVIKESLRLFPPGPAFAREAKEDCTLGDYFIPKHTPVIVPVYAMHRDPTYWKDPETFMPERFERDEDIKGDASKVHQFHWLAFGLGPRSCVGMRFALMEMKTVLAQVLQRYRFELVDGQVPLDVTAGITLSPTRGIHVKVHSRQA